MKQFLGYTEGGSKVGILTRRLLKIFRLERVTIAYGKAQVKTKILMQSRRSQKPIFESRSVYDQYGTHGQSLLKRISLIAALAAFSVISLSCPLSIHAAANAVENAAKINHPAESSEEMRLKKQLQETTKQLYEYKANLFRASHPHDTATINDLSQKIKEYEQQHENISQSLTALENELKLARKQIATLEISLDALAEVNQTQKSNGEKNEKFLREQITPMQERLYQANQYIEEEKALSEQLEQKLQSLNHELARSRQDYEELEMQHASTLADMEKISQELELKKQQHSQVKEQMEMLVRLAEEEKQALLYDLNLSKKIIEQKIDYTSLLEEKLNESIQAHTSEIDNTRGLKDKLLEASNELENTKSLHELEKQEIHLNHQRDLEEKSEQIEHLNNNVEKQHGVNYTQYQEILDLSLALEELKSLVQQRSQDLEEKTQHIEHLNKNVEEQHGVNCTQYQEILDLSAALEELKSHAKHKSQEIEHLNNNVEEQHGVNCTQYQEILDLSLALEELESLAKQNHQAKEAEIAALKSTIRDQDETIAIKDREIDSLRQEAKSPGE